jgi:N-methylhydantoinase A
LAEQLGIERIFVPPHAGVLSALGLAITAERRERMTSLLALTDTLDRDAVNHAMDRAAEGVVGEGWSRSWVARARHVGQGHELDVPIHRGDSGTELAARFATLHQSRNGFTLDAPVEIIAVRHVASGPAHDVRFTRRGGSTFAENRMVDDGGEFDVTVRGGAVVVLPGATLRIAPGWEGSPHHTGGWLLQRETAR